MHCTHAMHTATSHNGMHMYSDRGPSSTSHDVIKDVQVFPLLGLPQTHRPTLLPSPAIQFHWHLSWSVSGITPSQTRPPPFQTETSLLPVPSCGRSALDYRPPSHYYKRVRDQGRPFIMFIKPATSVLETPLAGPHV